MKISRLLALALVAASLACSTLEVSTDYDPATDFGRYRTFTFKQGAKARDTLAQERMTSALTTAIQGRGLRYVAEGADLEVFAHFILGKDTVLHTYGYGMGGWYGARWGGMTTTQVQRIPTGTVVVDLVDAKAKRLVWRGIAKDRLSRDASAQERTQKANEAALGLFEGFPPGGRK